jgi:hypothetical protein
MSSFQSVLSVFLFATGVVFAQEPNSLRSTAPERAVQVRVTVVSSGGTTLYDSDWKNGNIFDWSAADLPYGSYQLRILSRDVEGRTSERQCNLEVSAHRVTIDPELPNDVRLTTTVHDGTSGALITTSGDLSFRFGDYLRRKDAEAMRLSPEGNLEVIGWIRPAGGILFPDGSVLTSASAFVDESGRTRPSRGSYEKKLTPKPEATGTGTANQIAKWIDNAGTLGDSIVTESGGNVGIGTTTPTGKLHIFGGATSDVFAGMGVDMSAGPAFNFGYGGASFGRSAGFFNVRPDAAAAAPNPSLRLMTDSVERMIITNLGNVGIGTSNPGGRFQIFAAPTADISAGIGTDMSAGPSLNFGYGGATFGRGAGFFNVRPDASAAPPNPSLRFMTANVERMIITSTGEVGIGTSAPSQKLDVAGTVKVAGNLVLPATSSASAGVITIGGIRFAHSFGINGTFLGLYAGNFTMTGSNNTGIGAAALLSNTAGSANTAVGPSALQMNTTGFNNTAIGSVALVNNTTGANNTANGSGTLTQNSTGSRNVASGEGALFVNTTGADNTAIGFSGLSANTTGNGNIALGSGAGQNLTTGSNNIDVGNSGVAAESATIRIGTAGTQTRTFLAGTVTLSDNLELPSPTSASAGVITQGGSRLLHTFGSGNVFLGLNAGNFTMTGNNNTASGINALQNNTTGAANTAFGTYALLSNTTGFSNTAIGTFAQFANTTGASNTAIGPSALKNNIDGVGNVAIGDTALYVNTGNGNIAIGIFALSNNTTGGGNLALGGGQNLTTGSENIDLRNVGVAGESGTIRIGTSPFQARTFLAGVRDVTTGVADALTVMIDSQGQLGTVSSSATVKRDIDSIGDASSALLKLRPISFFYRNDAVGIRQYGLIAEEVAKVMPELVQFSPNGKPETVRYHFLPPLLLSELQKQQEMIEEQRKQITMLKARLTALEEQSRTRKADENR